MEETIIEIPENGEEGWQPPILSREPAAKPHSSQSVMDVFFVQYVVCILLITAFCTVRCFDSSMGVSTAQAFLTHTHAPTEPFADALLAFLQSRWS